MSSSEKHLHLTLVTPGQATRAVSDQLVPYCRQLWAEGQTVALVAMPDEDAKTLKQDRFYWGVILKEISEQARVNGVRYSREAWHEFFKRECLPRETKKVRVAGKARPIVTTVIGSTQGIGVKKMAAFITAVIVYAETELNVAFSGRDWESYR